MSKFKKGLYDLLLKESELANFSSNEVISNFDFSDDWLINQFSRVLKNKLSKYDNNLEKLEFVNKLLDNEDSFDFTKAIKKDVNNQIQINNLSENKLISSRLFDHLNLEFLNCNNVKLISPFISNQMVAKLENYLEENEELNIQIITTTYDGKAKFLALENLRDLYNKFKNRVQIRIENLFEQSNKRIHIKMYMFNRENGFGSLYLGSSNFTSTGQITGKEYNLKISEFRDKQVFSNCEEEFNKLWNQSDLISIQDEIEINKILEYQKLYEFDSRDIQDEVFEDLENMKDNLKRVWGEGGYKPFDYQKTIIENVRIRIENNLNKHLLVMATGTGKTVTMGFIYQLVANYLKKEEPSMIFIAHQKEILEQAKKTFSKIMGYDFGIELYDGLNSNLNLENENIIFTTIQTISRKKEFLKNQKFDIVVFDEAHHVEANSFKEIFGILENNVNQMFGLTATPERTDGIDVKKYFGHDYACELKLFNAIEKELLSDFDYFFIKDNSVDLTKVDVSKDKELEKYLNTAKRNEFVYENIKKYIGIQNKNTRTVLFCSNVKHARSLNEFLQRKNENSEVLVSDGLDSIKRKQILDNFKRKKINYLCVRDMFNEGIDVPEIDRVFFLRPTGSHLIYLQQLGRGLRKVLDKKLEVYDFVNNVDLDKNKKFNPFVAINCLTEGFKINRLKNDIDNINSFLPGESNFYISKMIKDDFIEKLKSFEKNNLYTSIIEDYREGDYDSYKEFFIDYGISAHEFYNSGRKFFKENQSIKGHDSIFKYFVNLNIKELLESFLTILETKSLSYNDIINRLFLGSYFYNMKKSDPLSLEISKAFNCIFEQDKAFINKELKFLIKYKLETEKLLLNELNEKIISFKGLIVNQKQIKNLCKININEKSFKPDTQLGGLIYNNEDKIIAIDASTETGHTRFGHGNLFDRNESIFYWDTPDIWQFEKSKINDKQKAFMNYKENSIFWFYNDEQISKKFSPTSKEFLGATEYIVQRESILPASEKNSHKKPKFHVKIG